MLWTTSTKLHLASSCLNMGQLTAKMLAEIEAITRVPLFDRTARGVESTAYGERHKV